MWCACNGPFAVGGVVAKIVAVASEGVKIGVVEEVGHDRKEVEKRGGVGGGRTEVVESWDVRAMEEYCVDIEK